MNTVYAGRHAIIAFYKRYEMVILFAVKLLAGFYIFRQIGAVGFYHERLSALFAPPYDFPYLALSAVLFACLPASLGVGLIGIESVVQISAGVEVAVFAGLLVFCLIVFYTRLAPKMSYVMIAALVCFWLKIPYAVVIFAGLYYGLNAILPVVFAALIYQYTPLFLGLAEAFPTPEKIDLSVLPQTLSDIYKTLFYSFTDRANFGWVFMGFSFAMTVIAVFAVSRFSFKRSRDLAVVIGGVVSVVCLLMGAALGAVGIGVGELLFTVFLSMVVVETLRFFEPALSYERAESVQFEDEDNYYYVKIVPKLPVPGEAAKRPVKKAEDGAAKTGAAKAGKEDGR